MAQFPGSGGQRGPSLQDLVDGAPGVLKEAVSKEEAESIKAALEGVGAEIELK